MMTRAYPWKNPIIIKEIRTRMRGNRAFILLTAHLLVLSLVVWLTYLFFVSTISPATSLQERRIFGKALFGFMLGMELVTISFVAPALTSGSISIERERQTYDILRVTLLSPDALVMGKYLSGFVFILLLLFTAIPVQSPAFLVGGITLQEILVSTLILLVTAAAFCAAGIFLSSLTSRTLVSTVLAYAFAIFSVFGIPILILVLLILVNAGISTTIEKWSVLARSVLLMIGWVLVALSPLSTIVATEIALQDQNNIFLVQASLPNIQLTFLSPWILYVSFYIALCLIFLGLSIRKVKKIDT